MGTFHARIAKHTLAFMNKCVKEKNNIGESLCLAQESTAHFKQEDTVALSPRVENQPHTTVTEVTNEDTLVAARRLVGEGFQQPCVLNFADAFVPGGLFLEGATTQEERLARCTGLHWCIRDQEYYGRNSENSRNSFVSLYLHDLLYSRNVPVFRNIDKEEQILEEDDVYRISIVTCPAPHASGLDIAFAEKDLEETIRERVRRILTVMANNGHEAVVLGAYGCGVFANDPTMMATIFKTWLDEDFQGYFKKVVFGVFEPEDEVLVNRHRQSDEHIMRKIHPRKRAVRLFN